MSKYIKLDTAIDGKCPFEDVWEDCIDCPLDNKADEPCKMGKWLKSLPTIEVSEDDLYIPLNNHTVERINRLYKDECGEYFDEEWLFSELEQIAEFRTVSEDCISRGWLVSIVLGRRKGASK